MEITEAKRSCDRWLPLFTGNRPEKLIEAYADGVFYRDPAIPEGLQGKPALLAYLRKQLARFLDWVYRAEAVFPIEGGLRCVGAPPSPWAAPSCARPGSTSFSSSGL